MTHALQHRGLRLRGPIRTQVPVQQLLHLVLELLDAAEGLRLVLSFGRGALGTRTRERIGEGTGGSRHAYLRHHRADVVLPTPRVGAAVRAGAPAIGDAAVTARGLGDAGVPLVVELGIEIHFHTGPAAARIRDTSLEDWLSTCSDIRRIACEPAVRGAAVVLQLVAVVALLPRVQAAVSTMATFVPYGCERVAVLEVASPAGMWARPRYALSVLAPRVVAQVAACVALLKQVHDAYPGRLAACVADAAKVGRDGRNAGLADRRHRLARSVCLAASGFVHALALGLPEIRGGQAACEPRPLGQVLRAQGRLSVAHLDEIARGLGLPAPGLFRKHGIAWAIRSGSGTELCDVAGARLRPAFRSGRLEGVLWTGGIAGTAFLDVAQPVCRSAHALLVPPRIGAAWPHAVAHVVDVAHVDGTPTDATRLLELAGHRTTAIDGIVACLVGPPLAIAAGRTGCHRPDAEDVAGLVP